MKFLLKASFVVFGLMVVGSSLAYACSCMWYETVEEHIDKTDVIFYGKAIDTVDELSTNDEGERHRSGQSTRFEVIEIWKGNPDLTQTIFHRNGNFGGNCGLVFTPNEHYLVMGHYRKDNTISSSTCSGTQGIQLETYKNLAFEPRTRINEYLKALENIPSTKYPYD